jgi:hypothetical protein
MGLSLHRGYAGKVRRGIVCRGLRKMNEGGLLEWGHLSLRELYEENLEGELLLLGTPKYMLSKSLEMGVCVHRGLAFGEHGGTLLS